MTIKEILSKAKVTEDGSLDESIVAELEAFVSELVEMKVQDKAAQMLKEATEPVLAEAREALVKEYEQKFEEFKDTVSTSFSDFVDEVFEAELTIPENVLEWAAKGEKYHDLIETLRTKIAVDEGSVNEEAKTLLKEAKDEIENLRAQLNKSISEAMSTKRDAEEMAANLYLRKKCDGLTEAQKMRVMGLLGGEKDANVINEKFDFIVANIFENVAAGVAGAAPVKPEGNPEELGAVKTNTEKNVEKECKCPKCNKVISVDSHTACELLKCPDCDDTNLKESVETKTEKDSADNRTDINEGFGATTAQATIAAKLYAQFLN